MRVALYAVLSVIALWGLHRAALYAESRGWIYYNRKRGSSGTLGNAFLEVQTLLEPSKRIVLEERRREPRDDDEAGGPKDPEEPRGRG